MHRERIENVSPGYKTVSEWSGHASVQAQTNGGRPIHARRRRQTMSPGYGAMSGRPEKTSWWL